MALMIIIAGATAATITELQALRDTWAEHDNQHRPQLSLNRRPPAGAGTRVLMLIHDVHQSGSL